MHRYGKWQRVLAIGLASLAGYTDAVGFLSLGGLFVSFMSGNSTRLAVEAVALSTPALIAAALIALFVAGVMAGAAVGRVAGARRKQAVLAFVTLLLLAATVVGASSPPAFYPGIFMALAMGAANNVFQREGEVSVGVTYMTGTLVKFGQQLTLALSGGPRGQWVPYLLLWLGLVSGGLAGAAAFSLVQLHALWAAVLLGGLLTMFAAQNWRG